MSLRKIMSAIMTSILSFLFFLTFPAISAADYDDSIQLLQQARASNDIGCWSKNIGLAITSLRSLKKEGDVRATEYLDSLANVINSKMSTTCSDIGRNTIYAAYDFSDVMNGYFTLDGEKVEPDFLRAVDMLDNDKTYKSYPGIREMCCNHLWRIVWESL